MSIQLKIQKRQNDQNLSWFDALMSLVRSGDLTVEDVEKALRKGAIPASSFDGPAIQKLREAEYEGPPIYEDTGSTDTKFHEWVMERTQEEMDEMLSDPFHTNPCG